jgi:fructose transport system ATP-binding protein
VITPQSVSITDVVAIMTGALRVDVKDQALGPVR